MLLFVPSRIELARLLPELDGSDEVAAWPRRVDAEGRPVRVLRCGLGPVLAGIRAAAAIERGDEDSLLLVGLVGSFDEERLPLGALHAPEAVELHGLGAGEGAEHRSLSELGAVLAEEAPESEGRLPLAPPELPGAVGGALLTCCSASASPAEAQARRARHADCLGEDMESWAVARAAAERQRRLSVLRAASNRVGDRSPRNWRLDEAFAALRAALLELTREAA